MWPLAILAGVALFWLWWTGRVSTRAMLPILLALLGLTFLLRGQVLPAGGSFLVSALSWFLARRNRIAGPRRASDPKVAEAEALFGLAPGYSQDELEAAYRSRANSSHPDHGGSAEEMTKLSDARMLLSKRLAEHEANEKGAA